MKRLYYCYGEDIGGLYFVAHSKGKAKMLFMAIANIEYIYINCQVLKAFDKKIKKYPLGEFEDYEEIGFNPPDEFFMD